MSTLTDLQLAFVRCRTYGHSWDEYTPLTRPSRVFNWQTHLRCTRCQTQRHDSYNARGEVEQREYVYPDGYSLAEKMTRAEFRLELRRRARADARTGVDVGVRVGVGTRARGKRRVSAT